MIFVVEFKSRTSAMRFCEEMQSKNLFARLVNQKKRCGLSVEIDDLTAAKQILSTNNYPTLCGIFSIENSVSVKIF